MDASESNESNDPFVLMGMEPRPWLPVAAIQAAYRERAKSLHPDAPTGTANQFAALNAAKDAIFNPASRLKHLADGAHANALEFKSSTSPPPVAAELGFEIGNTIRKAKQHMQEAENGSGLILLLAIQKIQSIDTEITTLKSKLAQWIMELECETKDLDDRWPARVTRAELMALSDRWQYAQRWQHQIRTTHFEIQKQLSMPLPKSR